MSDMGVCVSMLKTRYTLAYLPSKLVFPAVDWFYWEILDTKSWNPRACGKDDDDCGGGCDILFISWQFYQMKSRYFWKKKTSLPIYRIIIRVMLRWTNLSSHMKLRIRTQILMVLGSNDDWFTNLNTQLVVSMEKLIAEQMITLSLLTSSPPFINQNHTCFLTL